MEKLNELINQGEIAKINCLKSGQFGKYIYGEEYETWLACCTRYLQIVYPKDKQTIRFIEIAQDANGKYEKTYYTLKCILKSILEIPIIEKYENDEEIIAPILENFDRFANTLLRRHKDRTALEIRDEYDVQDLLQGILRLFIEDVRTEDYVPSYAGGNSRTDFYLPKMNTYIETKMTRKGLVDKKIGEELSVDIIRYGNQCKNLICFIYDKDKLLENPHGLIEDLEKLSSERIRIKVYISPL